MSNPKMGDRVKVHYTGTLGDGEVFDTSREREPFEFDIGSGNVIPSFEQGVIDMAVGETKQITIEPENAYGPRREELVVEVKKNGFPEDIEPAVGQQLQTKQEDGSPINVTITAMTEETVTLDANHPLAGQTLVFDIELVEILQP